MNSCTGLIVILVAKFGWGAVVLGGVIVIVRSRGYTHCLASASPASHRLLQQFTWLYGVGTVVSGGVMAAGIMVGDVPSLFSYIGPFGEGPWVWAFWVSVATQIGSCAYWFYFAGGDRFLVANRGLCFGWTPRTVTGFRLWYGLFLLAFVVFTISRLV